MGKSPIAAMALALVCAAQAVAQGRDAQRVSPRLGEVVAEQHRASGFAGVVGVGDDRGPVAYYAAGLADRAGGRPFDADTVSSLGSITKQFTAAAVLALEERGELSTTDGVRTFFPGAPERFGAVTLHHLLTHTSGLPADTGIDERWISRDDCLARIWAMDLNGAPGEAYAYSNAGYTLLAAVVETVSGRSYETFLRERFFEPLGMRDTGVFGPSFAAGRLAIGYAGQRVYGTVLEKHDAGRGLSWHLRGNGGVHSTAPDMLRWVRALRTGGALSEASVDRLWGRHAPVAEGVHHGYGWFVIDRGEPMISHTGGNMYFYADLRIYPRRGGLTTVLLSNAEAGGRPTARRLRLSVPEFLERR